MEDLTLECFIKELKEVKDEKSVLASEKEKLDARQEYLEGMIISRLRGEGLTKASTPYGTASIKTDQYPNIENWETALAFITENGIWPILKKSLNSAFWRELKESGIEIPGVGAFDKDTLLFRRK